MKNDEMGGHGACVVQMRNEEYIEDGRRPEDKTGRPTRTWKVTLK
jgi:hypothetical protein